MIEDLQLEVQKNDANAMTLRDRIIDHIVLKALDSDFSNQQKDQSEFSLEERKTIANDILNNSHSKFLYIFGKYLIEDHLEYFKSENYNNYETHFHLHRLNRLINSKKVYCITNFIDNFFYHQFSYINLYIMYKCYLGYFKKSTVSSYA